VPIQASQLRSGDEVKVEANIACTREDYEPMPPQERNAKLRNFVLSPEYCTEEIAWVYGYLVGDGSTKKGGYGISAFFDESEYDLKERFIDHFSTLFGVKPRIAIRDPGPAQFQGRRIHRTHQTTEVHFDSKILGGYFNMEKQPKRIVPDIILASKMSVVAAFLTGLYDADGCIILSMNKDRTPKVRIQLKSSSHRLLQDVQTLLITFGIQARIDGDNLMIARREDCRRFIEQIGFSCEKKKAKQDSFRHYCDPQPADSKVLDYEKVIRIEHLATAEVYPIECPPSAVSIINGVIIPDPPTILLPSIRSPFPAKIPTPGICPSTN